MLLRRAMLAQLRNPTDTTSRLFLSTWVGVLAGARPGCLMMRIRVRVALNFNPKPCVHVSMQGSLKGEGFAW